MHADCLIMSLLFVLLYCGTLYLSITKDNKISDLKRNLKDNVRKNTEEYVCELNNLSSLMAKCVNDFDCSFEVSRSSYLWFIRVHRIYKGMHFSISFTESEDKLFLSDTLKKIYKDTYEKMSDEAVKKQLMERYENMIKSVGD